MGEPLGPNSNDPIPFNPITPFDSTPKSIVRYGLNPSD